MSKGKKITNTEKGATMTQQITMQLAIPNGYEDLFGLTPTVRFNISYATITEILRESLSHRETFLRKNARILDCLDKIEKEAPLPSILLECHKKYEDLFEEMMVITSDWGLTWDNDANQYFER
jgi:hypothetical protein